MTIVAKDITREVLRLERNIFPNFACQPKKYLICLRSGFADIIEF